MVGSKAFEDRHDARMQHTPPLQQETAVGHLVGQSVFKSVFRLGEQAGLIEKLRRLQVGKAMV
jgi:hypothetical protein